MNRDFTEDAKAMMTRIMPGYDEISFRLVVAYLEKAYIHGKMDGSAEFAAQMGDEAARNYIAARS